MRCGPARHHKAVRLCVWQPANDTGSAHPPPCRPPCPTALQVPR
jgi:hypothetical protein